MLFAVLLLELELSEVDVPLGFATITDHRLALDNLIRIAPRKIGPEYVARGRLRL